MDATNKCDGFWSSKESGQARFACATSSSSRMGGDDGLLQHCNLPHAAADSESMRMTTGTKSQRLLIDRDDTIDQALRLIPGQLKQTSRDKNIEIYTRVDQYRERQSAQD